jgi:hypothetical protein
MKHIFSRVVRLLDRLHSASSAHAEKSFILTSSLALLTVLAASPEAFAGSVLQPGATIGVPTGAPLPGGLYFIDTSSYGQRTNTVMGQNVNLPSLVLATPLYFYDTRLQFIVLQPTVYNVYRNNSANNVLFLNSTLLAAQLAHTFGNGFGASYMAGLRVGLGAPQAYQLSSFEQRFAVSYTASGWDLTANLINGDFGANPRYPDWLNLDLTATKTFGQFEAGAVAFGSTDLNSPFSSYKRQRQFAVGGLLGVKFDRFKIQAMVTRDVAEHDYPGYDTRGWIRLIVPIYLDQQVAAAEPLQSKY